MILDRRDLLRLLGLTAGAASFGCDRSRWLLPDQRVRLALRGPGLESFRSTACGLCEAGCGLTVRLVDGLPVGLRGNPNHPVNRGGLCPVGQAGLDILYAPERLAGPLVRGADGTQRPAPWEAALTLVAERLGQLPSGVGGSVALLSGEPGGLFHDLATRFARALGSADIARVGMPPAAAFSITQGVAAVPAFDLAGADLVLSFGLDLFEDGASPLYASSALIGARPDERRCALVHVGTRLSPSAAKADLRVAVQPATHGAFALGVAHVLVREGSYDRRFVADHTIGFEDWTDEDGRRRLGFRTLLLERYYPERAARLCGCDAGQILAAARRLATASAPVAVVGGEALAGSNATWVGMAVHALNALVGAFDRPGGVVLPEAIPFAPLPDLPAPVGGDDALVFGPVGPALTADPVDALASRVLGGSHPVGALVVVGANPVFASPAGRRLAEAMKHIPLVVAITPFCDETAARADVVLPSHLFLESWRETTTPPTVPFSLLNLAGPVLEPLHDTRHPGDVLLDLAGRLGGAVAGALPWASYVDYLKARLGGLVASGQGTVVSGSFEEAWVRFLEERGWRFLEHGDLDRFWEDLGREGAWWNPVLRRGDWARLLPTPSGRFELYSRALERRLRAAGVAHGADAADPEGALRAGAAALGLTADVDEVCLPHFEPPALEGGGDLTLIPFRTTTGRGRLGATSATVLEMFGYPLLSGWQTWAELAPATAGRLGVADGDRIVVESEHGRFEAVAAVAVGAVPDVVHVPVGLGHDELGGPARGIGANPLAIVAGVVDPLSGAPAALSSRVRVRRLARRRHGGPAPLEDVI